MIPKKYKRPQLWLVLVSFTIAAVIQLATVISANAYDFNLGDWEGTLYTTMSYSLGVRAKAPRSILEINEGLVGEKGLLYQTQRNYVFDDAGDIYTSIFKVSPELMLTKDNYGFFARATAYLLTTIP